MRLGGTSYGVEAKIRESTIWSNRRKLARVENPKQEFDDEMVVEICLARSISMEGSNNRKIWHGG
ncbi:hypothetical protein H5410_002035 [Solanum commersonii]|uniref:Uncharacterized protein n=1 Tax=Solanum commersonii TaxID=4109 RepID=A0A9J6B0R2_SOLCO|nr:hypothetical protein H5410_002035 [Solanum commersonii]